MAWIGNTCTIRFPRVPLSKNVQIPSNTFMNVYIFSNQKALPINFFLKQTFYSRVFVTL